MNLKRTYPALVAVVLLSPGAAVSEGTPAIKATPLILEKNEGERRIVRGWPGHPQPGETFILKVDPKNGGSSRLTVLTAALAPGKGIEAHRHPSADEVVFLNSGTARVHVGATEKVVHGGSMVFIPANTEIALENVGRVPIGLTVVFSRPGFEEFMRESSVLEGAKNIPMTNAENDAVERKYAKSGVVIYKEP